MLEENNYYPFGLKHSGYDGGKLGNQNYHYKYNGKELQTELGINLYDYGARNYDPAIGRWFNIDPLAEKFNGASPFNYAANNPILFIDPDGRDIHITIGNSPVGTTSIRLIGASGEAPREVKIDIYKMTVTDDVTKKTSTYYVTRDAPVYESENKANSILEFFGFDETTYNVINTAFEPSNKDGKYKGIALQYPSGTDLEALALRNEDGSSNLDAVPNKSPERKKGKENEATGVMIHVGGKYEKNDGKTYSVGSFGCFGLCNKDSGNKGAKSFIKDIVDRRNQNKKASKGTDINVTVKKRKNVNWQWEVDKNGNKSE
ncbi:RHS repeat-associated core domain-containing protein [Chishuiella changwenlii]|uniref:RHS repeat-associated core domain-containing protein n=1 Tax=Chishuiella changwenlii TaxID=1434701 RepID=UPI0021D27A8E|nr:RHS repeat-associated core domain-containing protein [Chishuiella changwenlii]